MSPPNSLQIRPAAATRQLNPDQKRFNSLLRQIEQARATLAAWQEAIPAFRASHAQLVVPLHEQLRAAQREWVIALDQAPGRGWSRADHDTADEVLVSMAGEVLSAQPEDAALQALYARHAGQSFEESQREELSLFRGMAEAMTGVELDEDEEIGSEDELMAKLHQQLRQREADAAEREAKRPPKRKSAAQQRREAEAQQVTGSVRDVYRKLASALHPDREPDPKERAAKNELMAQVNDAYARSDLLALLELQLRIEQIDAEHLANADQRRLKHYNKVLSEQLEELRMEIEVAEAAFQMEFELDLDARPDPKRLGKVLQGEAAELRAALASLERERKLFADAAATRRWLKAERRRMQQDDFGMDFF